MAGPHATHAVGANSGIGRDAAKKLSKLGHKVYVACRTEARAKQAARETGPSGSIETLFGHIDTTRPCPVKI